VQHGGVERTLATLVLDVTFRASVDEKHGECDVSVHDRDVKRCVAVVVAGVNHGTGICQLLSG